jgi:hypothetical protein
MPARRSKRPTFRDENMAGGTSIAPEEAGGSGGWILALVLLLVGGGVAVYFATREDAEEEPAAEEETEEEDEEPGEPAPVEEASGDDDQPARPPRRLPTGTTPAQPVKAAVMRVDEALRVARLWAKVSAERTVLVIESSLCGDPGVKTVISGEADGLRTAGFESVRCQSPNGSVDFELGL